MRDFATAVGQEDETEVYGGAIKAPKVLADIVESVAAAVYVDCGFDLQALWVVSAFSISFFPLLSVPFTPLIKHDNVIPFL